MHPGNRKKTGWLFRLRLLYTRLQRLRLRRILHYSGEVLRFRRCSQRTFNANRETRGEFQNSFEELRATENEDMHFEYYRMDKECFDEVRAAVKPLIQHAGNHSFPVSAEERLAVTLRYFFVLYI